MAYPSVASASGTLVYITTTQPATHNAAGFDALADWEAIGYLTTGGLPKPVREFKKVKTLDGNEFVVTGSETMDQIEFGCIFQPGNQGQADVEAAADGVTLCFIKQQLPGAGVKPRYAAGYITGYAPNYTAADDEVTANFMFQPIFDDAGVGPVTGA